MRAVRSDPRYSTDFLMVPHCCLSKKSPPVLGKLSALALAGSIRKIVSHPEPMGKSEYINACHGNATSAIRLYVWNIEASAALWGGFSVLEVFLRNAMHRQLAILASREDWWNASAITLHHEQAHMVAKARVFVASSKGPSYSANDVVAELTLGFWTSLLANRYHQRLWVPALNQAFPHWNGRRGVLQQRLERLRRLRNRIAHHEPIFTRDLALDHADILEILTSIDPAARDWVAAESRLPTVITVKNDTISGIRAPQF